MSVALVAFLFNYKVKNDIIEAGCSEIAGRSSGLYYKERAIIDPVYSYDNLKARCLQEIEYEDNIRGTTTSSK